MLIDSASDPEQKRHLEVIVCIIESFNSRLQRYLLGTLYKLDTLADLASIRPCGLMDKAPDFGSGDCRFESCHGRFLLPKQQLFVWQGGRCNVHHHHENEYLLLRSYVGGCSNPRTAGQLCNIIGRASYRMQDTVDTDSNPVVVATFLDLTKRENRTSEQ